MNELREFYYLDSKLSGNYLTQIEDGLTHYKYEHNLENGSNHSFEISTGALAELLSTTLGVPLPDVSFRRDGKSKKVNTEEFKTLNEVSQFSRLINYLEPAILTLNKKIDREFWGKLIENQFIKFECTIKISSLYLFTDFTRKLGKKSIFNPETTDDFNEYVEHSEIIENKKSQKVLLKPHFSPDINRYYFVSEIRKRFLDDDISLVDLNNCTFTVLGKIDKKLDHSEKEIVFDLTETGLLEIMRSKDIKQFLKKFNKDNDNPLMSKFLATEEDVYATNPTMIFKPLAIYKA
ncbi:DUF6414 family protein [Thalassobacillus sp. B23F22_16]|uniref:DUF6414 family protein n=1 Tax=Thalassobacillus sp. B23F22_16 TaxID=3459513 RepID=UPI00373EFFB8